MWSAFIAVLSLLLSVSLSTPVASAQGSSGGESAKEIAHGLEAHYQHAGTLSAIFLESYKQGGELTQVETGKVYFSHAGRMRWDYTSPEKKLFLVDGSNVWFYVPSDHTASKAKLKESTDWRTPFALLTGKMNLARLCGHLTLGAPKDGKSFEGLLPDDLVLTCLPKTGPNGSDDSSFKEILLSVDPRYHLTRVSIREPGDVETDFQFGNWQEDVSLPADFFHFQPPQGVAIVDEQALASEIH